jgi:hypothetical protein
MNSYGNYLFYVSCYGLSMAASVTRQRAFGQPATWDRVLWTSAYAGFTAVFAALVCAERLKWSYPSALAAALFCGLFNEKATSLLMDYVFRFVRLALVTPEAAAVADPPGAGGPADLGRDGSRGAGQSDRDDPGPSGGRLE